MGEKVVLLDSWYQADTNHVPPVSVLQVGAVQYSAVQCSAVQYSTVSMLQPVDTRLKHFLNKKEPALQAQHKAAWWQVQSRLQGDQNILYS